MLRRSITFILLLVVAAPCFSQEPSRSTYPNFIEPTDLNLRLGYDVRTFVVMAALNLAGFDSEPGGQPLSPARVEIRKDLASLDPQLKARLAAFYRAHRRPDVDEFADAGRYVALSLMMNQPPSFSVFVRSDDQLPADLKPLVGFVPLLQEFYLKSGVKELFSKYNSIANVYVGAYRRPIGETIYETLDYFRTQPQTVINMRPLVVSSDDSSKKGRTSSVIARSRTRQSFVIPDPLSAMGTSFVRDDVLNRRDELLSRKVGDDYIVAVGPSRVPTLDGVRRAMIRFIIDPLVERHLKPSLEYKEEIARLFASVPTGDRQYGVSVYQVLRESLAIAAEARMRRIRAASGGPTYSSDEATNDLAQAYLRGAVLVFHFYEALAGLERVGINVEDFFDQMVATTRFDIELKRPEQFGPVVARVAAARKAAASNPTGGERPERVESATAGLSERILLSDDLIRQRRFGEARPILEEILAAQPNNARALYGMARIVNQTPSAAEADPKADENDKIQSQHERMKKAIELYSRAIERASVENEAWLIQWCHVLIGRIHDFQEFRADAVAEYDKALAMGQIPNGAYLEAVEGKKRPHQQKP